MPDFDWEEEFPGEGQYFGDDDSATGYLSGSCACGWKGSAMYWQNDKGDHDRQVEALLAQHNAEHPECLWTPTILNF